MNKSRITIVSILTNWVIIDLSSSNSCTSFTLPKSKSTVDTGEKLTLV
jgi:hypothetical protein